MIANPRLAGFFNRALSHEMAAVQQYLMQSRLAALWGMGDLSGHFRRDVDEELVHAERLMERMLYFGISANATQLAPVRLGRTVAEILDINRDIELEAVRLYEEAAGYCERVRDYENRDLFVAILREEIAHLEDIDRMKKSLSQADAL